MEKRSRTIYIPQPGEEKLNETLLKRFEADKAKIGREPKKADKKEEEEPPIKTGT